MRTQELLQIIREMTTLQSVMTVERNHAINLNGEPCVILSTEQNKIRAKMIFEWGKALASLLGDAEVQPTQNSLVDDK